MKTVESQSKSTNNHSRNHLQSDSTDLFFGAKKNLFFNSAAVQTKLTVGAPDDPYEKEADATADRVVQRLSQPADESQNRNNASAYFTVKPNGGVQPKCAECDLQKKEQEKEEMSELSKKQIFESAADKGLYEKNIQKKEILSTPDQHVNLKETEEGDDEFTSKIKSVPILNGNSIISDQATHSRNFGLGAIENENIQRSKSSSEVKGVLSTLEDNLKSSKGSGSPLSPEVKSSMGESFGSDFKDVRIHNDSASAKMNKDLNAQAFTHGSDIYFNEGKYDPKSKAGSQLLAHELTHTIQQGAVSRSKEANETNQTAQKISSPTISPKIQRSIVDDVAKYLLTGNAVLDFIVGVVAGIIEWIGDLIWGIISLFVEAFKGNIGAIIAIIGLVAVIILTCIFPEVMVPALIVIGIVAGVISLVYYIYMMTRPGLTPYERGKFLGKAIVEALLIILSVAELIKFVKTFAEVSRMAKTASLLARLRWVRILLKSGSVEKILKLLEEVKDVEKAIKILQLANDLDKALELIRLGKNADSIIEMLEKGVVTVDKLLDILKLGKVDDAAQVKRLLDSIKVADAEALEKILKNPKITNGTQLERLLGRAKLANGLQLERLLGSGKIVDGAQLETILDKAKLLNATQLERLLGKVKLADGAQLERLLDKTKLLDGAQLESLLDKIKLADGAQLEKLLGEAKLADGAQLGRLLDNAKIVDGTHLERLFALVDDGNRLERLLAMADTGVQLESFLTRAGGALQASNLEDLMRLAGPGRAARLEDLLNIAAGNAARFAEMADHVRWLAARGPAPAAALPPEVARFGFSGADMPHYLNHTFDYIDIPGRLANHWPRTTFWPRGTTPAQIYNYLGEVLRKLNPGGGPRLPLPGHPELEVAGGYNVQVGSLPRPAGPFLRQFFPTDQPGLVSMYRNELQAIWNILMP